GEISRIIASRTIHAGKNGQPRIGGRAGEVNNLPGVGLLPGGIGGSRECSCASEPDQYAGTSAQHEIASGQHETVKARPCAVGGVGGKLPNTRGAGPEVSTV